MMNKKNVVIVGAGPAGIFASYKLSENNRKNIFNITVIDKGRSIENRYCPMRDGKPCANCKPCNIMCGFGGAGSFSDSKLSLSPFGVGGDIIDYVTDEYALSSIKQVTEIFDKFDKDAKQRKIIGLETNKYHEIEEKLKTQGLDLTYCPTKHLGTDGTLDIMKAMYKHLVDCGVNFVFNTTVEDFSENSVITKDKTYPADYIIFAPGRSGNKWLSDIMRKHGVNSNSCKFDIGYRVEVPAEIVAELTDCLYDMKISHVYEDGTKVRTFCTNPNGFVSEEKYDNGIALANGHSYAEKKSFNTNFAVLVTYHDSIDMGRSIVRAFNNAVGGNIVINNFDYAFYGKNENNFSTHPTLMLPWVSKQITNYTPASMNTYILDFLTRLDKLYPGVASNRTNLYGMEAKFYSDTIEVKNNFETNIPNVYCVGDGSGIARGIIQSASMALIAVDSILLDCITND